MVPVKIPILREGEKPSSFYLVALKQAINSDGCSSSPDFYVGCCIIHDLGYRYGIDPWGSKLKKQQIDANLRRCMEGQSLFKRWSVIAKLYWLAVKDFGWKAYGSDIDERPDFITYHWSE